MNYTINFKTKNTEQFNAFLSFLKSFGLVEVIEVKQDNTIIKNEISDDLVSVPKNKGKAKKYYGLWKDKNIIDIKQFRENLWQRKK